MKLMYNGEYLNTNFRSFSILANMSSTFLMKFLLAFKNTSSETWYKVAALQYTIDFKFAAH